MCVIVIVASRFAPSGKADAKLNLASNYFWRILKPFSNPLAASRASTCRWKETSWATKSAPSLPNTRRSRRWRSTSPTSSRAQNMRPGRGTSSPAEWWSCVGDEVDGKRRGRGGGGAGHGVLNEGHSSGQCSRFFSVTVPLEYKATGEQSGVRIVGVKSQ